MAIPCYSARFIPPFAQVLSTYEGYAPESLNQLRAIDPGSRIPVAIANELAMRQVADTGDELLGLKAARAMPLGRAGALDYAIHSAATVRDAIRVASRYIGTFSDILTIVLEVEGSRALVRFEFSEALPKAALDFTLGAWFTNHVRPSLAGVPGLECWFAMPKPFDVEPYEHTFEPARLRFAAPVNGFAFDRGCLEMPLGSADAGVHALLCEHVAVELAELSRGPTLAGRVREVATKSLAQGDVSAITVARELRMSARTLGRRLEAEGTTFRALIDDLKRELALRFVGSYEIPFTEIAFRLGFSHAEAFYRAFRRWTGETPLRYRRSRRA